MALSRHTSRIYIDDLDIQGTIKVLGDKVAYGSSDAVPYYHGALLAFNLINNHSEIRNQADFIRMFEVQLFENGILESLEGSQIEAS